VRGGKQRDDFEPRRWSGGLVQFRGAGHLFLLPRRQFLKRVRSVVSCGGFEVSAHEGGVLSGGLEVPAHARVASNGGSGEAPVRWVAPDLVFFMPLQQHYGVGSCMVVVFWCGGVFPFCSSINAGTLQLFR